MDSSSEWTRSWRPGCRIISSNYLDEEFDQNDVKILERYKKIQWYGREHTHHLQYHLAYTPSGSNVPDNEDLNNDNTINEVESY